MVNTLKWSSIPLSAVIENNKRLEASVFGMDAQIALRVIHNSKNPTKPLIGQGGFVASAHYGDRLKRNYVSRETNGAIGFLGSAEMLDIYPKPTKYMINDDSVAKLRVSKGTILISRSGTIGNVTFVNNTLAKNLVSEHAIRLECYDYPGYVYTFLKSSVGKNLILSKNFGSVVQEIEPDDIASIPVPDPCEKTKKRINELIEESYDLRDESNIWIDKANALLKQSLQLPPYEELKKNEKRVAYSVSLSSLNNRLDGSYHVPIVSMIEESLSRMGFELTEIGNLNISQDVILPGRFKRVYVEEGYGKVFIGGKQIYQLDPANKKYLSFSHHEKRIKEQLELHENMILITCSGTIGKVSLVPRHWEGWAASQHMIRIVPTTRQMAGYLSIFLATDFGRELIIRNVYGSVIDEIDDNQVKSIRIPLLSDEKVQNSIGDMALKANELRYDAYCKEKEALTILNEEVLQYVIPQPRDEEQ